VSLLSEDIAVCISGVDVYQCAFPDDIGVNDLETRVVCSEVYDIVKSGSRERKRSRARFSLPDTSWYTKESVKTRAYLTWVAPLTVLGQRRW